MAKFDIGKWRATVDLGASASASICGALFFLETRVIAGDALRMLKIQTEAGSVSVGHAFRQI